MIQIFRHSFVMDEYICSIQDFIERLNSSIIYREEIECIFCDKQIPQSNSGSLNTLTL
jgi:hypothetical protein